MNEHQVRGWWGELRGRAKVAIGDLFDDPATRVEGTNDQLYGRMQRGYGNAKQAIQRGWWRMRRP